MKPASSKDTHPGEQSSPEYPLPTSKQLCWQYLFEIQAEPSAAEPQLCLGLTFSLQVTPLLAIELVGSSVQLLGAGMPFPV
jgi:hypothetical protein